MRDLLSGFRYDQRFRRAALSIMLPVALQQIINTLFNVVDQIMVGQITVGGTASLSLAAVSVANKPFFIYNGFFFGIAGGGGILLSQYFGAKDDEACRGVFSMQMLLSLAVAALFICVLSAVPEGISRLFVENDTTVRLSREYLEVVCWSYLPFAVSTTTMSALRALGRNRMPLLISLITMALNALLNAVFIFGTPALGIEAMGVRGAALGTLLSRAAEMCVYLFMLASGHAYFSLNLARAFHLHPGLMKSFLRRVTPLTANEIAWALGNSVFFWAYARMDESALSALSIADMSMQVGSVLSFGSSSMVSVLIGFRLGAGQFDEARSNCKKLSLFIARLAMVCTCIGVASAFLLPDLYGAVAQADKALATRLSIIYSAFFICNMLYAFCFFCLRAGGDAKTAAMLDSGYMWALPIPVTAALSYFLPGQIPITTLLLIVQALMNLKIVWAIWVVRKGRWVRNITQA